MFMKNNIKCCRLVEQSPRSEAQFCSDGTHKRLYSCHRSKQYNILFPKWENSLLLLTLKNRDLRVLKLNEAGDEIVDEVIYTFGDVWDNYGRLRDYCISPDGRLFVSTSNGDLDHVHTQSWKRDVTLYFL